MYAKYSHQLSEYFTTCQRNHFKSRPPTMNALPQIQYFSLKLSTYFFYSQRHITC